jgi:membrane associated rhomboid family serine protease
MIPIRDLNPTRRFALVNLFFITLCVAVWIYEISLPPQELNWFFQYYGLVPAEMFERPWSLITYIFIHGGWLHILGNMIYLWVFGDNVEDAQGHILYFFFFLGAGVFAGLTQAAVSFAVGNPYVPLIGASGAISGVLGAYMRYFPHARVFGFIPVLIFLIPIEWPAAVFIGFWFMLQILNGLVFLPFAHEGGVAWFAHIGGFIFGYLFAPLLATRRGF